MSYSNARTCPLIVLRPKSANRAFPSKDFSENDFTGHLPTVAIKNLPALQKFHVHQSGRTGNGIVGKLPAFREQTKLHLLDLNSNQLTGNIPGGFLGGVEDTDQLMEIE